ncbi:MAG: GreA/GreB family elongation factor [Planctomycetaceae bacterium]|nr:GreA/GreB family elongation factor [Planctomycetaceae bacterium]
MTRTFVKPVITHVDAGRLKLLLAAHYAVPPRPTATWLDRLGALLRHAEVIGAEQVRPDRVTMNSRLRVRDKSTREQMDMRLVFPDDANETPREQCCVSILSPMGLSLLGRREGDDIHGRLSIEKILYQPEAAGDDDV